MSAPRAAPLATYASLGASGPFTMDSNWLPYHPNPSRPHFALPPGAVDAHCHVFGPGARFPFAPERKYTPCDAAKETLLGIPGPLLASNGAVSAPIAQAMAERARALLGADFGVSCTGLAGPGADGAVAPVGEVFTALASPEGTEVRRHNFMGERDRIRRFAAYAALDPVRLTLLPGATR